MAFTKKLRIGQINTVDIETSDFASANSVNSVQANLTSLTSDVSTISGNLNALSDSAANDYNTYTTVTGLIDTVNSNVDALPDSAANDYNTYTTVTGLIDTVQANLTSVIGAAPTALDTLAEISAALENDANLAVTLTTSISTVQDNVTSLTSTVDSVDANLYNTYTTLSGFIDTVQDNVAASTGASGNATIFSASDQYTVSTSNAFTLSRTVSNPYDILVSLGGIAQYPNLGYVVDGTTLTLANTLPLKQGLYLEVRHLLAEPGSRSNSWEEVTSSSPLNGRSRVIVDTSSSAITLTLPLNPLLGDEVRIIDGAGNASNNAITLYGNGANIEADSSNVVVDVDRSAFTMVYYNTYQGWLFGEK